MAEQKNLPIGIQTLSKIRQGNYYYIDKTSLALSLIENGTHYFLSRPRRFGKSLFLDTLKELFEGNESLFEGLAVHHQMSYHFPQHPKTKFQSVALQRFRPSALLVHTHKHTLTTHMHTRA